MTNEGVEAEEGEEMDGRSSAVAYIGRASFRMEHTPLPGNDNRSGGVVQPASHEDTLRIRIPAPSRDWEPASNWGSTEPALEEPPPFEEPPPLETRPALPWVASVLVARLAVPRWILATMTLVVFAGGVLVAASVAGGTRLTFARNASPSAARARPALSLSPLAATPLAAAEPTNTAVAKPAAAARAERPISAHRAAKPAATQPPVRRPRKSAPQPSSAQTPRPEAITSSGWVDPFAQ